jgi:hypothetical protein
MRTIAIPILTSQTAVIQKHNSSITSRRNQVQLDLLNLARLSREAVVFISTGCQEGFRLSLSSQTHGDKLAQIYSTDETGEE